MPVYAVIVVEDDPEVCHYLASIVREHPDLKLLATAGTLAEGSEALRNNQPDILLTDLGLPDGSGVELIRLAASSLPDCKAMVVSGFQDEHRVFQALEAGGQGLYLQA